MKTIYPSMCVESSSFFTSSVAAALVNIRAQSRYRHLWHYFRPSPNIIYRRKTAKLIDVEKLANNVIKVYDILENKKFNSIIIGPGSGAAADIANAVNAPLLPVHTMVIELRLFNPIGPDDVQRYAKEGSGLAKIILRNNENISIIIHDDVIHDRTMVKRYLINRIKFKKLPRAYDFFIKKYLKKNGTIIFIENTQPWKQYKIEKNIWFQLGGYGGIGFREYVSGSERIDSWLKKSIQRHRGGWSLDYPLEKNPESEWGTPTGLDKDVSDYCRKNNLKFIKIQTEHITNLSLLSSYLWYERNKKDGHSNGYSIGTFWAHSPTASALSRYIPYWAPWPDESTLKIADSHLNRMINDFDAPKKAIFARHGAIGPDIVGIRGWKNMLRRHFDKKNIRLHGSLTNLVYNRIKKRVHSLATLNSVESYIRNITTWAKKLDKKSKDSLTISDFVRIARKTGLKAKAIS